MLQEGIVSKVKIAEQILKKRGMNQLIVHSTRYLLTEITAKSRIIDNVIFEISMKRLNSYMRNEKCLNDILRTAYNYSGYDPYPSIMPAQIPAEIKLLAQKVKQIHPQVIVEIGIGQGGTLYIWCRYIQEARKIISIDLPRYPTQKEKFFKSFAERKVHILRGDSHTDETEIALSEILDGEKIDFLFIDGDHKYAGVKDDFQRYKKFVRKGGMIAFHDIAPGSPHIVGGVPILWREIKNRFKHLEIVEDWNQGGYGIGILYM